MTSIISTHVVNGAFTIDTAVQYANRIVALEMAGGDLPAALTRLERRYGLGRRALEHLRLGRAKTCEIGLFGRLRAAYLDQCERHLRRLEAEIAQLNAVGGDHAVPDIAAEVDRLGAQIRAAKGQVNG